MAPIHYPVTLVAVAAVCGVSASPRPVVSSVIIFLGETAPAPLPAPPRPAPPPAPELITAAIFHIFLFALPAGCSSWLLAAGWPL